MEETCKESQKESVSACSEKDPTNQFRRFDTVESIASLALTVVELQKSVGSIQGGIQQLGMKLVELMQAHNAAASAIESLTASQNALALKVESLTGGTDKPENGTECTQNGVNTAC